MSTQSSMNVDIESLLFNSPKTNEKPLFWWEKEVTWGQVIHLVRHSKHKYGPRETTQSKYLNSKIKPASYFPCL